MTLQAVTKRNITPITGIGGFDLNLVPVFGADSILNVTVNVFVQDVQLNVAKVPVATFINDWNGRINEIWNNKIRFQSKSTGETIKVQFNVQSTASKGGANMPLLLSDGYASSSGIKFPQSGHDPFAGDVYLQLMAQDNSEYYIAQANQLQTGVLPYTEANKRAGSLDDWRQNVISYAPNGAAMFDVPMTKSGDIWSVDILARPALTAFCSALTNTPEWLVPPPIIIHSASGIQEKADSLAQGIIIFMQSLGVNAKIAKDAVRTKKHFKAPWSSSSTTAVVRVEVEGVAEMVKEWKNKYVVSAHEFGHCLGIPDEYLDYSGFSNATIKNSQPMWDAICTLVGVPKRNWHGQWNDSIMSIDRRLYPAHAVTLWFELDLLTQSFPNNYPPADWKILSP